MIKYRKIPVQNILCYLTLAVIIAARGSSGFGSTEERVLFRLYSYNVMNNTTSIVALLVILMVALHLWQIVPKKANIIVTKTHTYLAILTMLFSTSAMYSVWKGSTQEALGFLFKFIFDILLCYSIFINLQSIRKIQIAFWIIVALMLVNSIMVIQTWFTMKSGYYRLSGIYTHSFDPLSRNSVISILIVIGFAHHYTKLFHRFLQTTAVIIFAIALILTGSRANFLGLIIGCTVLFFLRRGRIKLSLILIPATFIILLMTVGFGTLRLGSGRYTALLNPTEDYTTAGHIDIFTNGLKVAIANPLLGAGLGNYSEAHHSIIGSVAKYPHNVFLDIAVNAGMIAVVCFILMLISEVRRALYYVKLLKEDEDVDTIYVVISCFFAILTSMQFTQELVGVFTFWIFLAILSRINHNMSIRIKGRKSYRQSTLHPRPLPTA